MSKPAVSLKVLPRGVVGPELWQSGLILLATYVYILGFFLLSRRAVEFCSKDYFAILLVFLAVTSIAIAKLHIRTWHNYTALVEQRADFDIYDFKYTGTTCYSLAKELIHIGVLVGFFRVDAGIGLYLPLAGNNTRPQVLVATCAFLMMMYASIAVTTLAVMDQIRLDYGFWFFFTGLIGGFIGYAGILAFWKRTQRLSIVYTMVGGVVAVLLALVFITDIMFFVEEGKDGTFQGNFADPCIILK